MKLFASCFGWYFAHWINVNIFADPDLGSQNTANPTDHDSKDCKKNLKELSLWNKIKYLNHNIFRTRCCKPLIFQTQIIWSNRIHSLKYLRYATFGSKDLVIRKSEFVAKIQFLYAFQHAPMLLPSLKIEYQDRE